MIQLRRLIAASFLLSVVGIVIGSYLIWVHYDIDALVCGTGGCEAVQLSEYATVRDIPVAIFGTAMYVTMLLLAMGRMIFPASQLPLSALGLAITIAAFAYSAWLTWLELFEIDAICQWCVGSAIVTTLLFAIEILVFRALWLAMGDDVVVISPE